MDRTTLEHTAIAIICTLIGFLLGNIIAGAAFGTALFIGREHAQAEYRWIDSRGYGKRSNLPWYGGFDVAVWDMASLLDWIVPAVVVAGMAFLVSYL